MESWYHMTPMDLAWEIVEGKRCRLEELWTGKILATMDRSSSMESSMTSEGSASTISESSATTTSEDSASTTREGSASTNITTPAPRARLEGGIEGGQRSQMLRLSCTT
jgi:hypothetical protein